MYSIVSDRSSVDRELQCMVHDGSLRRFRNIGSRSSDDDFFMRSANYTAALHRCSPPTPPPLPPSPFDARTRSLGESLAGGGKDGSFVKRFLAVINGHPR